MTRLVATLLTCTLIVAAPARAHAGCYDSGPGNCDGLLAAFAGVVIGGIVEGSFALGGVVSLSGGAHDLAHGRARKSWRVANYVFAALNLVAGVVWGGFAAANISPRITLGFAVPHLAIGAANLGLAIASGQHSDGGARVAGLALEWRAF